MKGLIVLGIVLFNWHIVFATYDSLNTLYPFLNLEENTIHGKSNIQAALRKIETAKKGNGRAHILHIGDSHIQADLFSNELRRRFTNNLEGLPMERGFLFPYSLAHTNNPSNYKVKFKGIWTGQRHVKSKHYSRWGLSGVTALTKDSTASFSIAFNIRGTSFATDVVTLFYDNVDEQAFYPSLELENNKIIAQTEGNGYIEFVLEHPVEEVTFRINKLLENQTSFLLQGVYLGLNQYKGVTLSASGVNGAEARHYGRCVDFGKHIQHLKPDLAIISLGTNDAYMYRFDKTIFKRHILHMIEIIQAHSPNTKVLLTGPGDNLRRRRYANKNNASANQVLKEIAEEKSIAFWDFYAVMGGYQSIKKWYAKGLTARDKLHLSAKGYQLQGQLLYHALSPQ